MDGNKRDRVFYVLQIILFILVFGGMVTYMVVSGYAGDEGWLGEYPVFSACYVGAVVLNCLGLGACGHRGYRPEKDKKPPG